MLTDSRAVRTKTSTFELLAGRPGRINLTTVSADLPRPLHTLGIYAVDGNSLTYCVAPPDRPRPAEFKTDRGDGRTLVHLRRA
jgi:hypothetical protein